MASNQAQLKPHSTSQQPCSVDVFEAAGVGMSVLSPEGLILSVNAELCRMLATAPDRLVGVDIHQVPAFSTLDWRDLIVRAAGGQKLTLEHSSMRSDGSILRVHSVLSRDDSQSVGLYLLVSVAQSTSAAAFSDRTSSDSPDLPFALLESVTGAIFAFDHDWRYSYVNEAAERFIGRSRIELLGRVCWEVFPQLKDDENGLRALDVMRSRQPLAWEAQSRFTGLWNQWRMYPMSNGGLSVFVENINDRVVAAGDLHASETRFRTLADLVPAFIWTNSADGTADWHNRRWLEFSGLRSETHQDEHLSLIHPDDRPVTLERMKRAWHDGTPARTEHRLRRFDGQYRWFLVLTQPITDGAGKIVQWVGAAIDVQEQRDALAAERTAREEAERARRRAEAAKEHLRTLLAAIPTPIAVTHGDDFVYELVNPAYEALIGKRQVLDRPVAEVFPSIVASGLHDILRGIRQTAEPVSIPERRVVYDREQNGVMYEGFFSSFMAPLKNEDGETTGVVISALEVTEHVHQRRRIEALREEADAARLELEHAHRALEERIAARTLELAESNAALAAEIEVRVRAEGARHEL